MKIPVACSQCMREHIDDVPWVSVDIRDDSVYEFICPKGHKAVVTLQEQLFEVLFDIGANAIEDGYYREAVSSFASSLERFYEFYIRAALAENAVADEAVEQSWRFIRKQSERQLERDDFRFVYILSLRSSWRIGLE